MFKFMDSLQIRTCGGVESNRGIKAVHVVVATSIFGHRSLLRRTLLRRAATVYVGLRNQSAREMTEGLGSLRISPGTRWSARWGRGRSKTSSTTWRSSGICKRELDDSLDLMHPGSIPSSQMILWSSRTSQYPPRAKGRPKSTTSNFTGTRVPVVPAGMSERDGEGEALGFSGGGGPLIGVGGRWPPSDASIHRRWIGRSPVLHRAACQLEEEDVLSTQNFMPGWTAVGWWDGLGQVGCGQVSVSLFFFCFISFLLFPVSCFAISNTNLLICFAGFELVT
jgi:hypothetical protein